MLKKYVLLLKLIKAKKKISMYDLAINVDVSYTVIRKFLNGNTNIKVENFSKIYEYIKKEGGING